MLEKLIRRIIEKPKIVILVSVLLMLPSALGFIATDVNYNLLSYLPDDFDSVQGEVLLDENFGCASMSFLIVENMASDDVNRLKSNIIAIDCVSSVMGVDDVLGSGVPLSMLPESVTKLLYSKDGSATLVLIQFSTGSADNATMEAISSINKLAGKQCFMSGLSAILTDTKNIVENEAFFYIVCAVVSALVMLTVLSKSWLMPPVVLYTLCSAVVYNMGTNIVFGEISYLTECIAVVLQLAVTMDYSVFLIERYHEELTHRLSKEEAVVEAVKTSISSLIGSSMTTIFGFAALCFMSLSLGMDVGLVMIKGVIFGMLSVIFVLPALLIYFDKPLTKYSHKYFKPDFSKLNTLLINKRIIFAVLFVVLLIPSYFLQSNVKKYYSLDEMLGNDVESIAALNKLKDDFGMASVDFAIVSDKLSENEMNTMLDELRTVNGINSVLAYNTFVGPAIPEEILPEKTVGLVRNGGKQMFVLISEYTAGHSESSNQINELTAILKSYDSGSYLTGEGPLTKDLVETADKDFKVTTVISIAAILIIIAILLKSYTIPFILVLAIELAIMINNGISTLMGSHIPFLAPAIVGCVQLGATVDYAILLTNRYRQEIEKGNNRYRAIFVAANASDYSIFKSVCVFFAATIAVYFVCDVDLVQDLCLLLARGSIISGAVIILLLTPILVTCEKFIFKTTEGWPDGKASKLSEPIAVKEAYRPAAKAAGIDIEAVKDAVVVEPRKEGYKSVKPPVYVDFEDVEKAPPEKPENNTRLQRLDGIDIEVETISLPDRNSPQFTIKEINNEQD